MPKYFSPLPLLLLALSLSSPLTWAAGKADQAAPMDIEADAFMYNDKAQRSVFTGRVQLSKGSIRMRGQRLEVWQDAAGQQYGKLDGSSSALAFFRQQRAGVANEFVEAQAQHINYSSKTGVVTLTGQAQFKRLQGQQVMDSVSGHTISYNGNTDVFSVNGGLPSSDAPKAEPSNTGRVRVTLSARNKDAAPEADPSAAPKPSLQLKSEAQP